MQTDVLYENYVLGNYAGFPIELVRGSGSRVWDANGREYLDFCTGLAVCSLGHSHPALVEAITKQAGQLIHISNLYRNRSQAVAARMLVDIVGAAGRLFFCNSGAEANEAAIKLARRFYTFTRGEGLETPEILSFTQSFHGRTLAGIAATGQAKVKVGFGPMPAGFRHLPYNDVKALREGVRPETAAIIVEAIQGEGGIHVASAEFLDEVSEICRKHNLLLICDEVQCGLGRAGEWCCWKSVAPDLQPDAVSWAKGMGGGYPIGAVWVGERKVRGARGESQPIHSLLGPGSHGTTYGGGPLGAAVVVAVLETMHKENLIDRAREKGAALMEMLKNLALPFVEEIRGRGLMIGLRLNEKDLLAALGDTGAFKTAAGALSARLIDAGLLAPPAGPDVLRLLPPLTVSQEELAEGLDRLRGVLADLG